ncbi:MAG: DUF433 domain-containing protein [Trichocoleus desertorum ATA4-8-CV12]|jgi:uncharacterized protein (DUF433 family)|nr:DUF433 domain-containing protein [Trichocoleus desertorum ATA4-8-CV12]
MSLVITAEPVPLVVNSDGVVLVSGTRVPLETIIAEFNQGATAEGIVEQYSSLKLADVYAVISYYLRHQNEVDVYLQQQQQRSQAVRQENERRFSSNGLRDRLLARRLASSEAQNQLPNQIG